MREMELRGFHKSTKGAYIRHVKNFAQYFGKSPENLGAEEIKEYLHSTHLLESGANIYQIQQLLGHININTTTIYLHLQRKDLLNIVSPLDKLSGIQ